jgi:hypothetical protein
MTSLDLINPLKFSLSGFNSTIRTDVLLVIRFALVAFDTNCFHICGQSLHITGIRPTSSIVIRTIVTVRILNTTVFTLVQTFLATLIRSNKCLQFHFIHNRTPNLFSSQPGTLTFTRKAMSE